MSTDCTFLSRYADSFRVHLSEGYHDLPPEPVRIIYVRCIVSVALAIVVFLLLCLPLAATALPVYICPKVAVPPAIDGKLDDGAWTHAPVVTFVRSQDGKPATKLTKAWMCWDDENLYISFDCVDSDVWGTLTKRDDPIYGQEVVEFFLAPSCDLQRYYEFEVSPRNVIFDAIIVNTTGRAPDSSKTDVAWTCKDLRTAVIVDGTLDNRNDVDRGWTAEVAIPFASLDRAAPKPGERWRANLYRIDLSPPPIEFQAWSPTLIDPANFHVPARFGTVLFSAGN